MRKLAISVIVASCMVCTPAFARPNTHASASEFVPCSAAKDGALVCDALQARAAASNPGATPAAFELSLPAQPLGTNQPAICQDMVRALPGHRAAMKNAEQQARGRTTYGVLVNQAVLALDAFIATKCSGGEVPMDDDGANEPPQQPITHVAAR